MKAGIVKAGSMKAVRFHSYGDSSVLVYEEADRPVAGPGQVVIQVAGAAFNPLDVAIRGGFVREVFPVTFPHIPNFDVSGVIAEVGAGVSDWHPGDAVVAFLPITHQGAAAEFVTAPADLLAAAPDNVDLADAAALPSPGLTAWQSLFEHAGLRAGQTLLVVGAGGAVGNFAVQLAKEAGATVTATASPRSADRLRAYGADRIVDYTKTALPQALAGDQFDTVLHLVRSTPAETAQLATLTADNGAFVSTTFPEFDDPGRGVRVIPVFSRSDAQELATLVTKINVGTLNLAAPTHHKLTDLKEIHDAAITGTLDGKPVLIP